jgi:hypothetical protein
MPRFSGQRDRRTPRTEGPAPAFRPLHAQAHPSARTKTIDPVRIGSLVRRSTSRPRRASRLFLGRVAKMLRIRFYNRRSRHEHSRQTSPLETARRAPWETRQRSTSRHSLDAGRFRPCRPRTAPDHLAVIRPPAAPCLTARRRLRSDRLRHARACAGGSKLRGFLGARSLRRCEPLTPFQAAGRGRAERAPFPVV